MADSAQPVENMSGLIVDFPRHRPAQSRTTVRRKVRFSEKSSAKFFRRYSRSDAARLWYSEEENAAMKWEYKQHAASTQMRLALLVEREGAASLHRAAEELDLFGVENLMTSQIMKRVVESRRKVVHAVMKEQARQKHMQEYDIQLLAAAARRHTRWSTERSYAIGMLQKQMI